MKEQFTSDYIFYVAGAFTLFNFAFEGFLFFEALIQSYNSLPGQPQWFQIREFLSLGFDVGLFFIFIRESFVARFSLKVVYLLFLSIALVTEYSYFKTFGRLVSTIDVGLILSSGLDHLQSTAYLFLTWHVGLPIVVYFTGLAIFRRARRPEQK